MSLVDTSLLEDGTVLRLVLNRPRANILSMAMMAEIEAALEAHAADPHLRLVILRGAGGNFSYGAAVDEHQRDQARDMLAAFHRLLRRVAACPAPVAALVEGSCLGGAFELALSCHLVFAAPGAVFGCPEIKLGVFPPVLAVLGAARLGGALAERLMLTGDTLDAEAALRLGFVTRILQGAPEQALLGWYREKLRPLSAYALHQTALAFRAGTGLLDALGAPLELVERQYLNRIVPSHDGNEGIAAFMEKRAPVWEDA